MLSIACEGVYRSDGVRIRKFLDALPSLQITQPQEVIWDDGHRVTASGFIR
jgi:hypothetical protein